MDLETYRIKKRKSRFQVAQEVGVDTTTIWRIEKRKQVPRPELIKRFADWSGGKVTAKDFWVQA